MKKLVMLKRLAMAGIVVDRGSKSSSSRDWVVGCCVVDRACSRLCVVITDAAGVSMGVGYLGMSAEEVGRSRTVCRA